MVCEFGYKYDPLMTVYFQYADDMLDRLINPFKNRSTGL